MNIRKTTVIAAITAIIGLVRAPAQALDPPPEVVAIQKVAARWFDVCATGEIAQLKALRHPDGRTTPEKEIEQLSRLLAVAPDFDFKLMLAKYSPDQAEAISYSFKIDHPEAPDDAVLILHLRKAGDTWKVIYLSGDSLRSVPTSYDLF